MDDINKNNQRLILEAHVIRPGLPGLDCLASQEPQYTTLTVIDGWVCCQACGNALGSADAALMVKVWDHRDVRVHEGGTAHLAFIG